MRPVQHAEERKIKLLKKWEENVQKKKKLFSKPVQLEISEKLCLVAGHHGERCE